MKKIFLYIALLAAAVSCDLYGDPGKQLPVDTDKVTGLEMTFSNVADSSFQVKLVPAGEISYYSYLVDEADEPEQLDSVALYGVKYEGIKQGSIKWTEEKPDSTITLKKLKPNTTYQVYAVAGSPNGVPSSIVVKSVTTTDGLLPELTDAEADSTTMVLTFSEAVTYNKEMTVVSRYFATKDPDFRKDIEKGKITVPADSISVDGKTVSISVPGVPAGAYFSIEYPEGTFVDSFGNKTPEMQGGFAVNEAGRVQPYGCIDQLDTTSFVIDTLTIKSFSSTKTLFTALVSKAKLGIPTQKASAKATFIGKGMKTEFDLEFDSEWGIDNETNEVWFVLPAIPTPGNTVKFSLSAGSVLDIYGNPCKEWSSEALYSFGYKLEDIIGEYTGNLVSAYDPEQNMVPTTMSVKKSDNADKGNVMITGGFGMEFQKPIYADFDIDGGTLTVAPKQVFFAGPLVDEGEVVLPEALYTLCVSDTGANPMDDTPIVFKVPEPGQIVLSQLVGLLISDGASGSPLTWQDIFGYLAVDRE